MADGYAYQPAEPDELRELRASVRACLDRYSPPERVRAVSAAPGAFDRDLWRRLNRDFSLAGFTVPEEFGGQGFGPVEHGVVLEELGRSLACVPVMASAVLATGVLLYANDAAARSRLLPGMAAGGVVATVAAVDRDGSEPARATRGGDGAWALHGSVAQVPHGDSADLALVLARTGPAAQAFFAVAAGAPGLTVTAQPVLDQTRPLSTMDFVGTPAQLVGAADAGAAILAQTLVRARAALAAEQLGSAARVLELATRHAATRTQFGALIGSFQAVKHACASMFAGVHLVRGVTYAALAQEGTGGGRAPELAAAAVVATADVLAGAAAANIQLHGAMGFAWEHPAHLYLKRATASAYLFFGSAAARDGFERALLDGWPTGHNGWTRRLS